MRGVIGLCAAGLLLSCAMEQDELGSQQQTVLVYKQNLKGGSANAYFYSETSSGHVWVNEAGTGPNTMAYLDYHLSMADPTSEYCETLPPPPPPPDLPPGVDPKPLPPDFPTTYCYYTRFIEEYGYGVVDGNEVYIGQKAAAVNTVVAPGPDFFIQRCIYETYPIYTQSCSDGNGGPIAVTWTRNGWYSSKRTGTDEWKDQLFSSKTSGIMSYSSADVQGTLLGNAFSDASGELQQTKGVSREIAKKL